MPAKARDEVRFTLELSPLVACRQRLKSIIVYILNEEDMSNIQRNASTSKKAIFPPPDGAKNIIHILDCDPNPTASITIFFLLRLT